MSAARPAVIIYLSRWPEARAKASRRLKPAARGVGRSPAGKSAFVLRNRSGLGEK